MPKTTTEYVRTFDTFGAFVDAAEREPAPGYVGERTSREDERHGGYYGRGGWFGTQTFADAVRLARHGWPEGRAAVERLSVKISDDIVSSLPVERMVAAVAGGSVDVGAYLSGDPACFITPEEDDTARMRQGRGPIVRIVANVSASADVSTQTITRRGAAVVALTDALERMGYRVEIVVTWCTSGSGGRGSFGTDGLHRVEVTATVKRPEEAVQIDQLAFALAHPSTFRRFAFALWETAPANIRSAIGITTGGGYGRVTNARAETVGTSDVMLPGADSYTREWSDDANAEKWVREALAAQGVTLEAR